MTLMEAQAAIVDALTPLQAVIADLQVIAGRASNPTPPSIDVYPDPSSFQQGSAFGTADKQTWWTVRVRVNTADEAAQQLLLRMLDPGDDASVEAALAEQDIVIPNDGLVTGFQDDLDGLLSCTWRVSVFL